MRTFMHTNSQFLLSPIQLTKKAHEKKGGKIRFQFYF